MIKLACSRRHGGNASVRPRRAVLISCRAGTTVPHRRCLAINLRRERMLASRPDGPALCSWLRDRKLAVVVTPQQCGEHGRFADLGLAGPAEQCQPPLLCKSAQV